MDITLIHPVTDRAFVWHSEQRSEHAAIVEARAALCERLNVGRVAVEAFIASVAPCAG